MVAQEAQQGFIWAANLAPLGCSLAALWLLSSSSPAYFQPAHLRGQSTGELPELVRRSSAPLSVRPSACLLVSPMLGRRNKCQLASKAAKSVARAKGRAKGGQLEAGGP